ncbi:MAG TPA: peptide-methionine (S)-S-oxide reductase MsrA [Nitrososphaerales archaeon]|nr:peptide-methionine (S)-S-oxide reductase MsrA [Nitrososphaerales archaeon]
MSQNFETATLGGGCFWCTEAIFSELKGVESVESGYSGGSVPNPSYEDVCAGETGHAEVVKVKFDPNVISYTDILRVFFSAHDPTTLNRQGADVGTQYRSVIFYHGEQQEQIAKQVMKEVNDSKIWSTPAVTEIVPFKAFYPAEEYHKDYFERNPRQPYCQVVIAPKVAKFRKHYFDRLKK